MNAHDGWRAFTNGVRAITDARPWSPQARGGSRNNGPQNAHGRNAPRDVRAGNGSADQRFRAGKDPSPSVAASEHGGSWEEDRLFWSQGVPAKPATRPALRRIPTVVVTGLIVLSIVIGFCATQGVMRALDLFSAALDAQAQVTTLEGIQKSGNYFSPAALASVQSSLLALDSDVLRVQADIPVGPLGAKGREVTSAFQMATDLIRAGEYGVDAGQTMIPHVKTIMSGLGSGSSASATPAGTLTLTDLERVSADINNADKLAQAALKERAQIKDSDLQSLHLGSVVHVLDKLDSYAPKVPKYVSLAQLGIAALQPLLGIGTKTPAHYLLFDQDSDESRPSGGFLGNFALLTLSNGQLQGGLQLKNVYTFDCPGAQVTPQGCPNIAMPVPYGWMNAGSDQYFGMRDANLEPDWTISASYIEQRYTQEVAANASLQQSYPPNVDGVFAFTPQFIGKVIDVLGGVDIPTYNVHVTSANLTDYIHYYHVLYAYCANNDYGPHDPKACDIVNKTFKEGQKGFDALIGSVVMHAVASASPSLQGKVVKAALDSLRTRDLQLYFNNPQIESLLHQLNLTDALPPVQGDQTLVENVNVGATYANADLQENIHDTVTLNANGSATHDMVIAYSYPWKQHLYNQQSPVDGNSVYIATTESYNYSAITRVYVPPTAGLDSRTCYNGYASGYFGYPDSVAWKFPPPGRLAWDCRMYLECNACGNDGKNNGQTPAVIKQEYVWTTPSAITKVNGVMTYDYTFVHQAGGHGNLSVTFLGPDGKTLAAGTPPAESTPLLGAPPAPVLAPLKNGGLQYGGADGTFLSQDVTFAVTYK